MKKAFGALLIVATISVMFGEDLSYQIDKIDEKYNTNIKETTESAFVDVLKTIFGPEVEIVKKEK